MTTPLYLRQAFRPRRYSNTKVGLDKLYRNGVRILRVGLTGDHLEKRGVV